LAEKWAVALIRRLVLMKVPADAKPKVQLENATKLIRDNIKRIGR